MSTQTKTSKTSRIFVGRVPISTLEQELKTYFSEYGSITDVIIKRHPKSGISKGYAFIDCGDKETYDRILSKKHTLGKVSLNCNAAFEAVKTNHLGNNDKRKVYLKGITKQVTDRSLKTHFTKFGKLIKIYAIRDAADLETKNFGFIECQSPQTAVKILKKETHVVSGVEIQALPFESQKKSQKNVKPLS